MIFNGEMSKNGHGLGNGRISHRSLHADRWEGIARPYSAADVDRLRGSVRIAYTLADRGARRLWDLFHDAIRHQREVGTGYFDAVTRLVIGEAASTLALNGSTEAAQF